MFSFGLTPSVGYFSGGGRADTWTGRVRAPNAPPKLERDPRSLFAGLPPDARGQASHERTAAPSPLPEMSPIERTLADYRLSGLTTGPQILAYLREGLQRRGVLSAKQLRSVKDGRFVRTAGHVIVRQHPGTAKGFTFLTSPGGASGVSAAGARG